MEQMAARHLLTSKAIADAKDEGRPGCNVTPFQPIRWKGEQGLFPSSADAKPLTPFAPSLMMETPEWAFYTTTLLLTACLAY